MDTMAKTMGNGGQSLPAQGVYAGEKASPPYVDVQVLSDNNDKKKSQGGEE